MTESNAFVLHTDYELKPLASPKEWTQNPSYRHRNSPPAVSIRTFERFLVETGQRAIKEGLLPKLECSTQIDFQVTGQNGLIWDSNPAFSDDDSVYSKVSSTPRLVQKLHLQRKWDIEATEEMPPWLQNDPDVEWMDVVETIDVGVQTDLDDQRSSQYRTQSRSVDSNASLRSEIGDPSRWGIDLCCFSDGKQIERTSRSRQSCTTSSESDTFNNSAPFWSQAGRKSIRETEGMIRVDLLEREVRQLKARIAEMEIELGSKESIIAKQDELIHRFTRASLCNRPRQKSCMSVSEGRHLGSISEEKEVSWHSRSASEGSGRDLRQMINAQQAQIKGLMEKLSQCRL